MATITPVLQSVVYSAVAQKASLSTPVTAASNAVSTGVQETPDIIPASGVSAHFIETSALYDATVGLAGLNSQLQIAKGGTQKITTILQNMQHVAQQIAAAEGQGTDSATLASLEAEFQNLYAQIDQTVNDTSFNGASLLDGSFSPDTTGLVTVTQDGNTAAQNSSASIVPNLGTQSLFGATPPSFATAESTDAASSAIGNALNLVEGVDTNIDNISNQANFAMASIETAQANNYAATSTLNESDGLISFIAELMSKPSTSSSTQTSKMQDSSLKLLNG